MIVHCWPGVWFFVVSQRVLFFVVGHCVRHRLFITDSDLFIVVQRVAFLSCRPLSLILNCWPKGLRNWTRGLNFAVGHWVLFLHCWQCDLCSWSMSLADSALLTTGFDSPLSDTETPFSRCFDAEFASSLLATESTVHSSSLLNTESTVVPRCWTLNLQ